jgi:glucokinase
MILDGEHTFEYLCSSHAQYLWNGEDPLDVEIKARKGDKSSKEIYNKFGFWVGVGVANIVNVMEPESVVIGGGLSKAWDLFETAMLETARKYIGSTEAKKVKIVRAKLGDDAGAVGAAYLV